MRDRIGQQLGNYRLVELIGRGGFADVYLGQHVRLQMQAAIKVLHANLGKEEAEDFVREAQTVAQLSHPHIVRVFDFDVDQGAPFLVMDYAPNGSLRTRHPKGSRIPPAQAASYIQQVASALQYAHDKKLIHRDVKPENMLLNQDERVVLGDFGIATFSHNTGSLIFQDPAGTVAYMAPEQIQAAPRPASDQYALGIVAYEWLCGERPFQGTQTEIVSQQESTPPPSLRTKVPALSAEIESVVFTALAKDPHQRFPSVKEFAQSLEAAIALEYGRTHDTLPLHPPALSSTTAPAPSPIPQAGQPALPQRRRRIGILLSCLIALLLLGSSATFLITQRPLRPWPGTRAPFTQIAPSARTSGTLPVIKATVAPVISNNVIYVGSDDGLVYMFDPTLSVSKGSFVVGNTPMVRLLASGGVLYIHFLDGTLSAFAVPTGERLWSIASGQLASASPPLTMTLDDSTIYFTPGNTMLYAIDIVHGAVRWKFRAQKTIFAAPAIANGVVYVGSFDHHLYALRASNGEMLWKPAGSVGMEIYTTPIIAGGLVYISSADHGVYGFGTASGQVLWAASTLSPNFTPLALHNDTIYVGASGTEDILYAINTKMRQAIWQHTPGPDSYSALIVDNGMVYFVIANRALYALNATSGAEQWVFPSGPGVLGTPIEANGIIYFSSINGALYALNAITGRTIRAVA